MNMKRILILLLCAGSFASCGTKRVILPRAVNTIDTAPLEALNLTRGDYEILNTITADASIIFQELKDGGMKIADANNEFSMSVFKRKFGVAYECDGSLKLGYLQSDYFGDNSDLLQPEVIARRLAIYRAINLAKEYGADALVEPTIATNVEQVGKKQVLYKTTVTAKIIKLKTDR